MIFQDDFESETAGNFPDAPWVDSWTFGSATALVQTGGRGQVLELKQTADGTGGLVRINSAPTIPSSTTYRIYSVIKPVAASVGQISQTNNSFLTLLSDTTTTNIRTDKSNEWDASPSAISPATSLTKGTWYGILLKVATAIPLVTVDVEDLDTGAVKTQATGTDIVTSGEIGVAFGWQTKTGYVAELHIDEVFFMSYTLNEPTLSMTTGEVARTIISNLRSTTSLGGGGQLTFDYRDKNLANYVTALNLTRGLVGVTNNAGTRSYFSGEMLSLDAKQHHYLMMARETIGRFQRMPCGYNPVLKEGVVKHISGTVAGGTYILQDHLATFSGYNDKIIIFGDSDKTLIKYYPVAFGIFADDTDKPDTPTTPVSHQPRFDPTGAPAEQDSDIGAVTNLYFYNPDMVKSSDADVIANMVGAFDNIGPAYFWYVFDFEVYIKKDATLVNDELVLKLRFNPRHLNLFHLTTGQKISIYDYTASDWRNLETYTSTGAVRASTDIAYDGGAAGTVTGTTGLEKEFEFIIDNALANHLDDQGNNGQNFHQYDFRLAISSGNFDDVSGLFLQQASIEGVASAPNYTTGGTNKVSSTAATALTLATVGSNAKVVEDGVIAGDKFTITETISTIMTNIWTSSGANNYLVLNSAAAADNGDVLDLTDIYLYDVLTRYAELLDRAFWQVGNQFYFKAPTTSSGLVFTEVDIVDYNKDFFSWKVDSSNVRTTITTKGIDLIRDSQSVSAPAYTTNETEIYNKADIGSPIEANTVGLNLATNKHKNSRHDASLTINLERTDKDYSALELGTTCTFTPNSANVSAVTFVIEEITVFERFNVDHATIGLKKRG